MAGRAHHHGKPLSEAFYLFRPRNRDGYGLSRTIIKHELRQRLGTSIGVAFRQADCVVVG